MGKGWWNLWLTTPPHHRGKFTSNPALLNQKDAGVTWPETGCRRCGPNAANPAGAVAARHLKPARAEILRLPVFVPEPRQRVSYSDQFPTLPVKLKDCSLTGGAKSIRFDIGLAAAHLNDL